MRHISAAEAERIINTIGARLHSASVREIRDLIDGPVHVNRVTAECVGRTPREPNWTDAYKVGDVVEVSLDAGQTFDRGYVVEHVEARNFRYVSARRSDGGRAVFCHDPGIIRHLRSSAWTDAYKGGDPVWVRLRDFDGKLKTFEAAVEYVFEDRKSMTVLVPPAYAASVEDPARIWKRGTFPRGRNGGY